MKSKKHPVLNPNPLHRAYEEEKLMNLNLNPLHRAYEKEKASDFESEPSSSDL